MEVSEQQCNDWRPNIQVQHDSENIINGFETDICFWTAPRRAVPHNTSKFK